MPTSYNSNRITAIRGTKHRWGGLKITILYHFLTVSQKQCRMGTLWKANRNVFACYRMVLFPVTLSDSYLNPNSSHISGMAGTSFVKFCRHMTNYP